MQWRCKLYIGAADPGEGGYTVSTIAVFSRECRRKVCLICVIVARMPCYATGYANALQLQQDLLNPMALFNLNGNCIVQLELHFRDLF
jgi:hypothetical protein